MKLAKLLLFLLTLLAKPILATQILIPMDESQKNHLKAYGICYKVLNEGNEAAWLLNYRGGSFQFSYNELYEKECKIRGVSYEVISEAKSNAIAAEISNPESNMEKTRLLKAPKIAVYSPKSKQPWDDAVTMVLTYAEIPYDVVFDDEVLTNKLPLYDWLHLHHEDFTGQYGKFWSSYRNTLWYREQVKEAEDMATKYGYKKVSKLKLAVAKKIRDFTIGGGFLFAMCSATDSYDIALAAEDTDICESMFDGDPADPKAQSKLKFENCIAFENFKLERNPMIYEYSDIDMTMTRPRMREENDEFALFEFSAKSDVVPTMLCQNHTQLIKGFYGQTTSFNKKMIKSNVTIMGENNAIGEAKYIHGTLKKGTWTFYAGHDPEDYQHMVNEPPTDLNLYPNSPGYRLILNNILFPSAKKKKLKT